MSEEKIKYGADTKNAETGSNQFERMVTLQPFLYKIHNEDCRETLAKLPPECVDLVVTSPPYDELRTYKGHEWNFEIFKEIAEGLTKVLKPGGVIVWVVNDQTINGSETLTSCKQKIYFREKCGLNIHDTMFYHKNGLPMRGSLYGYNQTIEYMFVLSKGRPKTINIIKDRVNKTAGSARMAVNRRADGKKNRQGICYTKDMTRRENVWSYNTGEDTDRRTEHPAIFPEALAQDHILSWSNEDDIVYDPFSGSGTTCKVADRLGRAWFGSEIAEEYCEVALRRVGNDLFTKLQGNGVVAKTPPE